MNTKATKRFVIVSWRAGREPVDDMYWCEAEFDGVWTNVIMLDKIRARREIFDRLTELEGSAVVGLDFPFSFPKPFVDFLADEGISGWRSLAERIRDDLKKNTDDGIRLWIDRIGRYRESKLESMEEALNRLPPSRGRRPRTLSPQDLRSYAERFRRIDTIVRHKNDRLQWSPVAIRHNKLTGRYEFEDSEARGRKAFTGIPFLVQALEAKDDVAVWPFQRPTQLTLVEIVHEVFRKSPPKDELPGYVAKMEDYAWHAETAIIETAMANDAARQTLFSLIGMMQSERREDKNVRPLRDFRDAFYDNDLVRVEGWVYGIGFRDAGKPAAKQEAPAESADENAMPPPTEEADK